MENRVSSSVSLDLLEKRISFSATDLSTPQPLPQSPLQSITLLKTTRGWHQDLGRSSNIKEKESNVPFVSNRYPCGAHNLFYMMQTDCPPDPNYIIERRVQKREYFLWFKLNSRWCSLFISYYDFEWTSSWSKVSNEESFSFKSKSFLMMLIVPFTCHHYFLLGFGIYILLILCIDRRLCFLWYESNSWWSLLFFLYVIIVSS